MFDVVKAWFKPTKKQHKNDSLYVKCVKLVIKLILLMIIIAKYYIYFYNILFPCRCIYKKMKQLQPCCQ